MMWYHASQYLTKVSIRADGNGYKLLELQPAVDPTGLCISFKLHGFSEIVLCKACILICERVGFIPNLNHFSRTNDTPHMPCLSQNLWWPSHPLTLAVSMCLPVGEFQVSQGDDGAQQAPREDASIAAGQLRDMDESSAVQDLEFIICKIGSWVSWHSSRLQKAGEKSRR